MSDKFREFCYKNGYTNISISSDDMPVDGVTVGMLKTFFFAGQTVASEEITSIILQHKLNHDDEINIIVAIRVLAAKGEKG